MNRKHKAMLKLNIVSLFLIALSSISVTLAWFAYSGIAKVSTEIDVKSWLIEFEKNSKTTSNEIVISTNDIYPGMETIYESIKVKNKGDSNAKLSYSIISARIFDEKLEIENVEQDYLKDKLSHNYPFSINIEYGGKPATCALNPRCGHENGDIDIPKTDVPKKLVIVGAGPGGCMAALYAKAAGHTPVILERGGQIGGKLHAACKPWFKADMARLITYLETRLRKENIPVHYYTEASEERIAAYSPDAVLWAAGSSPKATVEGSDLPNVYAAEDALLNRCYVGKRVLVVGGGMTGVETALHLDKSGHEVICAARAFPAKPGFKMNDDLLKDLMAASNVQFIPKARLQRIEGDVFGCKAYLTVGEEEQVIDCDPASGFLRCPSAP